MTSWIIESAIAAAVLAGLIALASRALRPRPALRHALWLVVLVKLLSPPLVSWPFTLPEIPLLRGLVAPAPRAMPAAVPSGPFSPSPISEAPDRGPPDAFPGGIREAEPAGDGSAPASLGSVLWFAVGMGGALIFAILEGTRIHRLRRLLAYARPAPTRILELVAELSAKLGVRPPPTLVGGRLASPIIACLGRARLLLPEDLVDRLDPAALRSVIAHELAHLRRKDHWVGWLELAGGIAWWWNPVYWIARRQLRDASELACDAWVVWALPGARRTYAETLIEVCRLMAPGRESVLAHGMGHGAGRKFFRKRLTMILLDQVPCKTSRRGLLTAALIALAFLPGWPGCSPTTAPVAPAAPSPGGTSVAPAAATPMPDGKAAPAAPSPGAPPLAGDAKALAPTADPAAGPSTPPPDDCGKSLEEIRKLFAIIPDDYRQAPNLEDLIKTVKACRDRSEEFVKTCRGAADFAEAQFMLARCILSMNRMEWMTYVNDQREKGVANDVLVAQRPEWAARYFGRVIELGSAALERFEAGKTLRAKCLDLLGDAHFQAGQAAQALERYLLLLKEFPEYSNLTNAYLATAKCYQELRRYTDGIDLMRKAIAQFPKDPNFPFFYETLWQLHTGAGDLAGLLKLVEEARSVLAARLKAGVASKIEKEAAERYLVYGGFRLGYARFALGDFSGAADAFQDHIASLDEMTRKSSELPQDYQVYRTRSKDNLDVLISKIGKPSPNSLAGVVWAGDRKPDLAGGKPLAIIFRNLGDDRSSKFVQAIDAHRRKSAGAYNLVVISFLRGTGEPASVQAVEAFTEAQSLGIECPVGLDSDLEGRQIFRAFNATVGSATLVIVDHTGNYVWFQQDPWQRDIGFSTAILERILAKR